MYVGPVPPERTVLSRVRWPSARSMAKALIGALVVVAHPVGLVGGVQPGAVGVQDQVIGAGPHLDDAGGRHRAGGAIDPEEVDAPAVAGRQVHLRRQHVPERRSEGADIGDEGFVGLRAGLGRAGEERGRPGQGDGGLQKRATGAVERGHGNSVFIGLGRRRPPAIVASSP